MRPHNPTPAHLYRYRHGHAHALWESGGGGWVGGWEGGRWGGSMGSVGATNCGTTPLRSHQTYRDLPHPGGVCELIGGGPPRLLRAAVPLDMAVVLTSFPPKEPTCRLVDKGRLGSLGGW